MTSMIQIYRFDVTFRSFLMYDYFMKKCTRCGTEKTETEFQVRKASKDGLTSSCKKCLSDYDKSRASNPSRVQARIDYLRTKNGKRSKAKSIKKYRESNPKKYKAHNMINNAIRDGKLFSEPCEVCGSTDRVHAHHDDYSKPLNVRWLCPVHHKKWHDENGEGKNSS